MISNFSIGQWQVFFTYGAEYGEYIEGQEVEFRLFVESFEDGVFTGRSIDWSGVGTEGEKAKVHGFVENDFISFTKKYDQNLTIEMDGSLINDDTLPPTIVVYEGAYEKLTGNYTGKWEITVEEINFGQLLIEQISSGTWYMRLVE